MSERFRASPAVRRERRRAFGADGDRAQAERRHVGEVLRVHPGAERDGDVGADGRQAEDRVTLAAIFGPQHGFRSDVQDNMIETPHRDDATRRVPVYSLYSETREPTDDMLRGLDVLVVDLQDIGARIYTYIYTVANCLKA